MNSNENLIILAPKFEHLRKDLSDFLNSNGMSGHVVFISSGTTSLEPKGYVFTKEALIYNAQSVNSHLGLTSDDIWGLSLPPFHVGGISVIFRASLLGHTPIDLNPWDPIDISNKIIKHMVTVISLVPTQVYDLVKYQVRAPHLLKSVLVGGDFLSIALEEKARLLGWPIVRTFGMSELGSQIATAKSSIDRELEILKIHELKTDQENRLWIKGPSLFSFEIKLENVWKLTSSKDYLDENGFYPLPDLGLIKDDFLTPLGRYDGKIKSSGRLIDLIELKEKLDRHMLEYDIWGKMDLVVRPHDRKGCVLSLEFDKSLDPKIPLMFQESILPIVIDEMKSVDKIERNELGKKTKFPQVHSQDKNR
jgi:O-succinylbenzoic acid--CoA ligase